MGQDDGRPGRARKFIVAMSIGIFASLPVVAQEDIQQTGNGPGFTGDWGGARSALERRGITFFLDDQNEAWRNFTGGLRTGNA